MATLRPNWFLISPSLIASGASSLMIEKSCLIPIVGYSSQASQLNGWILGFLALETKYLVVECVVCVMGGCRSFVMSQSVLQNALRRAFRDYKWGN